MSRDETTLLDVLDAAKLAVEFLGDRDEAAFKGDLLVQAAIQYKLLVLGEAVKRLSEGFRQAHPEVSWRQIAGMRDHLAHGYDTVDLSVVWESVRRELPGLIASLESLQSPDD